MTIVMPTTPTVSSYVITRNPPLTHQVHGTEPDPARPRRGSTRSSEADTHHSGKKQTPKETTAVITGASSATMSWLLIFDCARSGPNSSCSRQRPGKDGVEVLFRIGENSCRE